jgi:uncharacterized protein (TIGR02145 family)
MFKLILMEKKYIFFIFSILVLISLLFSCERFEPKPPEGTSNKIELKNDTISILSTSASILGKISKTGNHSILRYGHCWSTENYPDTSSIKSEFLLTTDTVEFTTNLANLVPGYTYFIRAYAVFDYDVAYSEIFTIRTSTSVPNVVTKNITNILSTSATTGGTVINDGGEDITAKGICWASEANPTLDNFFTDEGIGDEDFESIITNLTPGIDYYVRAYATNVNGTGYGNEITFQTNTNTPQVSTISIDSIRANTAYASGEVINNGGLSVTARGFCWNTSHNPTINNSLSNEGSGVGAFANWVSGLSPDSTYYIRAYATNSQGTGYGEELSFTTINLATVITLEATEITPYQAKLSGNITDNGGNNVTARGVCWAHSPNPTIEDFYINEGYGNGPFEITATELNPGQTYYYRAYATNIAGTSYGNELTFTTDVILPTVTTNDITEITGTTAVSGGSITDDGGGTISTKGVCWSLNPNPTTSDFIISEGNTSLSYTSTLLDLSPNTTYYIKAFATNEAGTSYGGEKEFQTIIDPPTVRTSVISNITPISALSGGDVSFNGGATVTERGVCWAITPGPTIDDSTTSNGSGTGNFNSSIDYLDANTTYYIRAYATNEAGISYGDELNFTTLEACEGVTSVTYESIIYNAIEIGNQCWMKENLNVGTKIDNNSNQINNSITEKYCYNFDENNCDTYGGLYQWDEVMQYISSDNGEIGTTQGICPDGWHIPTNNEFSELAEYLGGDDFAGKKLKELGNEHWEVNTTDPTTVGTNESGFTGLPAGIRLEVEKLTQYLGITTFYWSSSSNDGADIEVRSLHYQSDIFAGSTKNKGYGYSVRCVKNIGSTK